MCSDGYKGAGIYGTRHQGGTVSHAHQRQETVTQQAHTTGTHNRFTTGIQKHNTTRLDSHTAHNTLYTAHSTQHTAKDALETFTYHSTHCNTHHSHNTQHTQHTPLTQHNPLRLLLPLLETHSIVHLIATSSRIPALTPTTLERGLHPLCHHLLGSHSTALLWHGSQRQLLGALVLIPRHRHTGELDVEGRGDGCLEHTLGFYEQRVVCSIVAQYTAVEATGMQDGHQVCFCYCIGSLDPVVGTGVHLLGLKGWVGVGWG